MLQRTDLLQSGAEVMTRCSGFDRFQVWADSENYDSNVTKVTTAIYQQE